MAAAGLKPQSVEDEAVERRAGGSGPLNREVQRAGSLRKIGAIEGPSSGKAIEDASGRREREWPPWEKPGAIVDEDIEPVEDGAVEAKAVEAVEDKPAGWERPLKTAEAVADEAVEVEAIEDEAVADEAVEAEAVADEAVEAEAIEDVEDGWQGVWGQPGTVGNEQDNWEQALGSGDEAGSAWYHSWKVGMDHPSSWLLLKPGTQPGVSYLEPRSRDKVSTSEQSWEAEIGAVHERSGRLGRHGAVALVAVQEGPSGRS